jgi:hypothetical protein
MRIERTVTHSFGFVVINGEDWPGSLPWPRENSDKSFTPHRAYFQIVASGASRALTRRDVHGISLTGPRVTKQGPGADVTTRFYSYHEWPDFIARMIDDALESVNKTLAGYPE